jgi:V/A-type H+-transporting ATPase subunit C
MYSKRLTEQNYSDMLSCKSVGEIASYLKNRTAYKDIFDTTAVSSIHRGQLEPMLKKHIFKRFEVLCRYELSIGQDFYKYFVTRSDIDMILTCVKLLYTGSPEDYLLYMPVFITSRSQLDQLKLAKVKSVEDLVDALDNTEYKAVLEPYAKKFDAFLGKLNIEAAFNNYKFNKLKAIAQKGIKGKNSKEVLEVLQLQNDIRTIINIYRLKKLLNADKELIKQFLMPELSRLSEKELSMLAESESAADLLQRLNKTIYGAGINVPDFEFIEQAAQKYLYKWHLKALRFSRNPDVVMFSYVFLLENEVRNITHIIEGIRYDVPTTEIKKMLIGTED